MNCFLMLINKITCLRVSKKEKKIDWNNIGLIVFFLNKLILCIIIKV